MRISGMYVGSIMPRRTLGFDIIAFTAPTLEIWLCMNVAIVKIKKEGGLGCAEDGAWEGGWLARHSTIKKMGPPHRMDI